jgi:hypothetical protein
VIPLSGTFVAANPNNADYRNPAILSGIEFTDISGAPSANQFTIFKLDASNAVPGTDNTLIENTVIKCKSLGGLPRLRFDLSSYGDRRNYFIKDHSFTLKVKALVGEENSYIMGGGRIAAWIHTQPRDGLIWSWTRANKWEHMTEEQLSIPKVLSLSHSYSFPTYDAATTSEICLNNVIQEKEGNINDNTLLNINNNNFETFEIDFDTRNFTIHNNSEYLDIIPIPEEQYKITNQVNQDDTNYIVELFMVPNTNADKYLLIDSIELQDVTQRENAAIGTGHGIETSGIPNRRFVKEDMLYLTKDQLQNTLKFYNGLIGQDAGVYSTSLASRDAVITSGIMELSGGSRLNYRRQPEWGPLTTNHKQQANWLNYTIIGVDN